MIRRSLFLITTILLLTSFGASATDVIFQSKSATALNKVSLYTDSSFSHQTNTFFREGELFEVLSESKLEHEDDAQNQKFKWYKVRTQNNQEGWIFGDGIALIVPDHEITPHLRSFHKQRFEFDNGFEKSVMWIASIEGHDNFHEEDYLNPTYKEFYIVITNERGRSVHVNFGGISAMGKSELRDFQLTDVTGDSVPDFIVENSSYPVSSNVENRSIEIYSIQAGTIGKIFEERMTLSYDDDLPSPALYKYVEIDKQTIRVAYVDYVNCKSFSLPFKYDLRSKTQERCLEYVTYTYTWDKRKKVYSPLYEESRACVKASPTRSVYLKEKPSLSAQQLQMLNTTDVLKVIKHFEKFVLQNGKKKQELYFYVQNEKGDYGYVDAHSVRITNVEHGALLYNYYQNPPLSKTDWNVKGDFLRIVQYPGESVTNK